jgi:hypothetical protein
MTNKNDLISEAVDRKLISDRIKTLEIERAQFLDQANQNIAAYNAGIAELQNLLNPPVVLDEEEPPEKEGPYDETSIK